MGSFSRVALQGDIRGLCSFLLLGFLLYTTTSGLPASAADGSAACRVPVARVVSIQGTVEIQAVGQAGWSPVTRLDTPLCDGDRLRTGPTSRSALFVQPESLVRVDRNTTIAINQLPDETLIEFFQDELRPVSSGSCGAGYFISRFPKKFKVKAPHLSAAVEGTEFLVALNCESDLISVFEGKVLASQTAGNGQSVLLEAGQTATAGPGEAPVIKLNIKPEDAVQWVVYYPPITPPDANVEQDCRNVASDRRAACLVARAERLLRAGNVDEARSQINDAIEVAPLSSDAKALQSIISLVRNEKSEALRFANEAVAADPKSAPAWLALSYAQQSDFKLEAALTSAQQAVEITPNNSLALARVAELQLSLGWNREAEKTAKQAVAANDSESRAHMILGFVHLAQIKVKEARADFERAIELDSTEPLSRLGLGLAIIRKGNLAEGREQIEIAVALDPTNSLLRSYVGKAYYEENSRERDQLASSQFELAKQLDPKDPTPWFYGAILENSQHRPSESLSELHRSYEKNDHRAVYRSRLLLDNDAAARTAETAGIYRTLGFEKLAILESTHALQDDASSYAAHKVLATGYANIPRYDIARVSEALQAQIRQPLSNSTITPLLGTENLAILRDAGMTQMGVNEFNPLFNKDGVRGQLDLIAGSNETVGEQLLIGGQFGSTSLSFGQLHYKTDGFVDNDSAERDIYDIFFQKQFNVASSVQVDIKRSDFKIGETFFRFDPDFFLPVTISEDGTSYRISGQHRAPHGSEWIWTVAHEDRYRLAEFYPDGEDITDTKGKATAAEVQYHVPTGPLQTISGLGVIEDERNFQLEEVIVNSRAANAYFYGLWRNSTNRIRVNAGAAFDQYERKHTSHSNAVQRNLTSPKLGLVWSPRDGSTIRAAAFSSLRRPLVTSQTIEPTQLSGFNQFFSGFEQLYGDLEGTISQRSGIGFDQRFSETTHAGLEASRRRLKVPSINLDQDFVWHESSGFAYFYKSFRLFRRQGGASKWSGAFSLETEFEKIDRPPIMTGSEGIIDLETTRIPIGLRLFHSSGTALRLGTAYVKQSGTFSLDVGNPVFTTADAAWITDIAVEYHMPRRLGTISVGIKNVTDSFIDLLETDPLNPRTAIRRFYFLQLRLNI